LSQEQEERAALEAALAEQRAARAVVTRKFAAVANGHGANPTPAELEAAKQADREVHAAKTRVEELRLRIQHGE
jgi:hypothetical protein